MTSSAVLTEVERRNIPGLAKLFVGAAQIINTFRRNSSVSRAHKSSEGQNKLLESSMNYY